MAAPISSGRHITWTDADDGEASPFGYTKVTAIKISGGATAAGTVTLQENGSTFFSETVDAGDYVELLYDGQMMKNLTPTAIPAGITIVVEHK